MRISIEQLSLEELQSFLREQAEDSFPDLKDAERLKGLSEKWNSHAEFCICRNDEGLMIGMIAFYANRPDREVVYFPHVYVRSECRGQKIMTSMLYVIERYVKERGFKSMCLEVNKSNSIAQIAYTKYGFSYCGEASDNSIYLQFKIS